MQVQESKSEEVLAASPAGEGGVSVDPIRILRKHLLLLIFSCFIGVGVGGISFVALSIFLPKYRSEALFEIRSGLQDATEIGAAKELDDDDIQRRANTEISRLMDRDVLKAAVRTRAVQRSNWFTSRYVDEDGPRIEEAVDELEEDLGRSAVSKTALFRISFATASREDSQAIVAAISEAYLESTLSLEENRAKSIDRLFNTEFADTRRQISDITDELEDFITANGVSSLEDPRYSPDLIAAQQLTERIYTNRQTFQSLQTQVGQSQQKLDGTLSYDEDDLRTAETDPSVLLHLQNVEASKRDLSFLRLQYLDSSSPIIQRAAQRLQSAEAALESRREEVVLRNLRADIRLSMRVMEQTQAVMQSLQDEYSEKVQSLQSQAADLSRIDNIKNRRDYLERKRDGEDQLVRDLKLFRSRDDARLVSLSRTATLPREMAFPKPELVIPAGFLLVTGLVVGVVFLREFTDQRIKGVQDLSLVPGLRTLGVVPHLEEDPEGCPNFESAVLEFGQSVVAESLRQTWTQLSRSCAPTERRVVVFFPCSPDTGCTGTVLNVAATAAAAGRSVLVIDGDFRRPGLAEQLGLADGGNGLGDVLAGTGNLSSVAIRTEAGFDLVGAGTESSRVVDRLGSPKMDEILGQAREQWDLILFDAPPALAAGDALTIASKADGAVVVVHAGQDERGLLVRLANAVRHAGAEVFGVVLNQARTESGGYFKKNFRIMRDYSEVA
ncbi:MAG TPA: hypothetical protein DEQ73_02170 [Phycisphaerales bacterium]|nr:hypothetical protein [Phycisphaerales bacterium]